MPWSHLESRCWSLIGWANWKTLTKNIRYKKYKKKGKQPNMPNTLVYPSKHHLLYTFIRPTDQEGYQLSQDFQIGSCVYIAWVKPHSWSQLFVGHQSQQGPNRRCLDIQNDVITSCKVAVSLANNNDIPNFAVPVTDKYSLSPAMPQKLRRHVHEHIRQHHLKQRNQTSPIFSHSGNLTNISTLKGYKKRLFLAEIFVSMLWNIYAMKKTHVTS